MNGFNNQMPRFDEMRSGDIYAAGGMGGYEPEREGYQAPTYTIPEPREEVKRILDESGYSDKMIQDELTERKAHIKRIAEKMGIDEKDIEVSKEYTREPSKEMAKKYEESPPQDKMMIAALAEGQIQPDEYRSMKMEQEEAQEGQILDFLKIMAQYGGEMSEKGKPPGITGEKIEKFAGGAEDVTARFKGQTMTYRGTGRGGRGGTPRKKRPEASYRATVGMLNSLKKKVDDPLTPENRKVEIGEEVKTFERAIENMGKDPYLRSDEAISDAKHEVRVKNIIDTVTNALSVRDPVSDTLRYKKINDPKIQKFINWAAENDKDSGEIIKLILEMEDI